MRRPVATLPVKTSLSISLETSAAPVALSPGRTRKTSLGIPASRSKACNSSAINGVNSEGLSTTALPATSAATVSVAGIEKG